MYMFFSPMQRSKIPTWAGGPGQVLASTMPGAQNRAAQVQLYYEDDPLCLSRYIIYLWEWQTTCGDRGRSTELLWREYT